MWARCVGGDGVRHGEFTIKLPSPEMRRRPISEWLKAPNFRKAGRDWRVAPGLRVVNWVGGVFGVPGWWLLMTGGGGGQK